VIILAAGALIALISAGAALFISIARVSGVSS
jgi:hypothetical protein